MGSGGGGSTNTIQSADPWVGAQPYLTDIYERSKTAADSTPTTAYGGNFVTQPHQLQRDVATQLNTQASGYDNFGNSVIKLGNDMAEGRYINNNPHLQSAINATIRPTIERTRDVVLPGIGSAAQTAGAYGGSRQAFLESQTLSDVNKQVADTAAQMWNQNYQHERQLQMMAPSLLQAGHQLNMTPIEMRARAGDLLYSFDDAATQNNLAKFEDDINRHWRQVNPYVAAMAGIGMPGGQSTSTTNGARISAAQAGLTGAVGGAAMGGMAAGAAYGSGAGPYGALIGAALGAGMGLLSR